jgi:large conductance mechanosensitive channel
VNKKNKTIMPIPTKLPEISSEKITSNVTATMGGSVNFVKEFVEFLKKFGVIGLAIGAVVGGAVTTLVKSFTENILTPILNIITKAIFNQLSFLNPEAIKNFLATFGDIKINEFIGSIVNFVVLMFIVYFAVKIFISKFLTEDELKALKM